MAVDAVIDVESLVHADEKAKTSDSIAQLYGSLPISYSARCIRLLDLQSSDDDSASLQGNLRVVDLDHKPRFFTLSYVWGRETDKDPSITLVHHRTDILITQNCYDALLSIRKRYGATSIWVDAICINQNNLAEKESQIPLMRDVYSCARTVLVWLGNGSPESDKAMKFLRKRASLGRRLALTLLVSDSDKAAREARKQFRTGIWRDILSRLQWSRSARKGVDLNEVLNRDWILRSWTFQEAILATNITAICGEEAIAWDDLVSALCAVPRGSGTKIDGRLPVAKAALDHWRSVIDLWFRLPRILAVSATAEPRPITLRQSAATLWRKGDISRSITMLYWSGFWLLWVLMTGVWILASYYMFTAVRKKISQIPDDEGNGRRVMSWYFLVAGWLIALAVLFGYTYRMQKRWHFILHGWKQQWLSTETKNSKDYAVLDAARVALRERTSKDPRDKAYALHGILKACGVSTSTPDYSLSVTQTYRNLIEDLLTWNSLAIALLMDASSTSKSKGPTWIPRWDYALPSHWLTSKYVLGVSESCTPIYGPPGFNILGRELHVRGYVKGRVVYSINFQPNAPTTSTTHVTEIFRRLLQFLAFVNGKSPKRDPNDQPVSALFALLEGHSPRRGPTQRLVKGTPGGANREAQPDRYERLPLVQGPYDFRDRAKDFADWTAALDIFAKHYASVAGRDGVQITTEEKVKALMDELLQSKPAARYLQKLLGRVQQQQKRGFYVLEGGLLGTGPMEVKVGDEVYLITGIPTPMVLRRAAEAEEWRMRSRVVGATLVHGLMHGEGFRQDVLGNIILV